jgi:hypothetical protein
MFVGDVRSGGGGHSDRHKEVDGLLALPVPLRHTHMRDRHRSGALDRRRVPPLGRGNTPLAVAVVSRPVLVGTVCIRLRSVLCPDTHTLARTARSVCVLYLWFDRHAYIWNDMRVCRVPRRECVCQKYIQQSQI